MNVLRVHLFTLRIYFGATLNILRPRTVMLLAITDCILFLAVIFGRLHSYDYSGYHTMDIQRLRVIYIVRTHYFRIILTPLPSCAHGKRIPPDHHPIVRTVGSYQLIKSNFSFFRFDHNSNQYLVPVGPAPSIFGHWTKIDRMGARPIGPG